MAVANTVPMLEGIHFILVFGIWRRRCKGICGDRGGREGIFRRLLDLALGRNLWFFTGPEMGDLWDTVQVKNLYLYARFQMAIIER